MDEIRAKLKAAVGELFAELAPENVADAAPENAAFLADFEPSVTIPPENTGADYASNVAMALAKKLQKSPMEIAEMLKAKLASDALQVEIAPPGFLNFISPDAYYLAKIAEIGQNAGILAENIPWDAYDGKTVVAEFSDPNPFKVLHVGHLYTSVVGDAISRLLERAGARVVRANFGGDVGLHVAKTLYCLKQQNPSFSGTCRSRSSSRGSRTSCSLVSSAHPEKESSTVLNINLIAECYVEGTKAYDEDEQAKAEITKLNKMIYALADLGEAKSRERLEIEKVAEDFELSTAEAARIAELYWAGRRLSYEYFADFYARIGVKFDKYYPESSVAGRGLKEVRAHVGEVYEESDGAVIFRGEKVGLHTRVFINKEGVPTYEAKDVGLIFTKWDDWKFDESVVITGNEQAEYMKVVLASVREFAPELVERTEHLTHGLVKLKGGVKMSSRMGNFLKAIEVVEMVERELSGGASSGCAEATAADSSIREKRKLAFISEDAQNREAFAESRCHEAREARNDGPERRVPEEGPRAVLALAALKYAFLKYKMGGDIVFDPQESVATTGNSGVYLLYSAVRAKKILAKCMSEKGDFANLNDDEQKFARRLNKKIVQYAEVLREATAEKAPYKICTFLYELAQEFSRFYENVQVAGNENEGALCMIVRAYLNVMTDGLGLLGIEVPEEM